MITKKRLLIVLFLVTLATVAAVPVFNLDFRAQLSGDEEVPPVDTQGRGQATFQLSKDGTALTYRLFVANIEDVTQAHIHCGTPGVNGPVVAFLFGLVPEGVTVHGTLAKGTLTNANVIPRPASPECPGGVADFDDLVEKIQTGGAYANVHTLAHPPGEIRGHIHSHQDTK